MTTLEVEHLIDIEFYHESDNVGRNKIRRAARAEMTQRLGLAAVERGASWTTVIRHDLEGSPELLCATLDIITADDMYLTGHWICRGVGRWYVRLLRAAAFRLLNWAERLVLV